MFYSLFILIGEASTLDQISRFSPIYFQLDMFLNELTTQPVGFTPCGIFLVTKESVFTVSTFNFKLKQQGQWVQIQLNSEVSAMISLVMVYNTHAVLVAAYTYPV